MVQLYEWLIYHFLLSLKYFATPAVTTFNVVVTIHIPCFLIFSPKMENIYQLDIQLDRKIALFRLYNKDSSIKIRRQNNTETETHILIRQYPTDSRT